MNNYNACKVCNGAINLLNQKYDLIQCNNCKLIFCSKIYSQSEFITLYDELYNDENSKYNSYSVEEFNMLVENKKIKIGFYRSRFLKKYVLNGKCNSVLEIGSGIGLIGSYIRKENEKINYTGVEIDTKAFEKSQTLKLNTINADFTEIVKIEETFDVIMLWEVFEHLQDLNLFLKLAHKKLNKNGRIILSTPNYEKILNYPEREKDNLYQDGPPIHVNFFTKESIKTIFEFNQFENCIVKVKKFPGFEVKNFNFCKNILKAIFNNFHGSTIFLLSTKKKY